MKQRHSVAEGRRQTTRGPAGDGRGRGPEDDGSPLIFTHARALLLPGWLASTWLTRERKPQDAECAHGWEGMRIGRQPMGHGSSTWGRRLGYIDRACEIMLLGVCACAVLCVCVWGGGAGCGCSIGWCGGFRVGFGRV